MKRRDLIAICGLVVSGIPYVARLGYMSGLVVAVMMLAAAGTSAQQVDRKKVPPAGKPPVLHVPTWTTTKLSNGAQLIVSERKGLPLVSFTISFVGGANQFERAGRVGIASLTAAMMREGTRTRDGEALSQALQLLGTSVNVRRKLYFSGSRNAARSPYCE